MRHRSWLRLRRGVVHANERSPRLGLKPRDLQVLYDLRQTGWDLEQPLPVTHRLEMVDAGRAQSLAKQAAADGYRTEVEEQRRSGRAVWVVRCRRGPQALNPDVVRTVADYFDGLAEEYDGEYVSWEAS